MKASFLPLLVTAMLAARAAVSAPVPPLGASLDVAPVWAGHPVQFDLYSIGNFQFVAFYDTDRWMTVASRVLTNTTWKFKRLPSQTGWDSHSYVTLGVDSAGFIHVSGNMHNEPLVYFRSTKRGDVDSLVRVPEMTGLLEGSVTQPRFFCGTRNELLFSYRHGVSGNAINLFNVYDVASGTWSRLLDVPILSGEGSRSAYPYGPSPGPDGFFHMFWVWRDSFDIMSNHDLSYARSRDFVNWETRSGSPIPLPIVASSSEVVDPIPPGGGLLNGSTMIGFDSAKRVIVTYQKFDEHGYTQLYQARLEDGTWHIYQTTRWKYRWELSGPGFISEDIKFRPLVNAGGSLLQWFRHAYYGEGVMVLDDATLAPRGLLTEPMRPPELELPESKIPNMKVQWQMDRGSTPASDVQYYLRWETLDYNRDLPCAGTIPPPSMLRLHGLKPMKALDTTHMVPIPTSPPADTVVLTNVVADSTFPVGMKGWGLWQTAYTRTADVAVVPCTGVSNCPGAVRMVSVDGQLIGIQQNVQVVSGVTYRLSGQARSMMSSGPSGAFGARIALHMPSGREFEVVWQHETAAWLRKEYVFQSIMGGEARIFVHLGYGHTATTGEFTNVRLEEVVLPPKRVE